MSIALELETYDRETGQEVESSKVMSYKDAIIFFAYIISRGPDATVYDTSYWGFTSRESSSNEYIIDYLMTKAKEYMEDKKIFVSTYSAYKDEYNELGDYSFTGDSPAFIVTVQNKDEEYIAPNDAVPDGEYTEYYDELNIDTADDRYIDWLLQCDYL